MMSSSWLFDMVAPMCTKIASSAKSLSSASTLRSAIQRHLSFESVIEFLFRAA